MSAFLNHKHKIFPVIVGLFIAFVFFANPVAAHAAWFDIGGMAFEAILDLILGILVAINSLLGSLLSAAGQYLRWVLSWQTTELTVVEIAWTVIRDMCNLAFIVVFIGISFATIFNATGWIPGGWHYKQALSSLIIAALLINFSLAIGKTVVLASNAAMQLVLNIVSDPGQMLVAQLKPQNLVIGGIDEINTSSALNAPLADVMKTLTAAEQERYNKCLTEEKIVTDTNENAFWYTLRFYNPVCRFSTACDTKVRKAAGDCILEINDARFNTTPKDVAIAAQKRASPELPEGSTEQKIMFIGDAIFKAFMILIFISCLGSAASFLAFRVLMTWVLLAVSPLAWLTFGIPGQKAKGWSKWWEQMIAWNVFGPLYLLTLIPGLVMLGGSAEMLQRLQSAGANIGVANALFQQLMYYVFAAMIFIGGLGLSLKSSFAGTVAATEMVGDWAKKMGVFQSGEAKFGALGRYTGISPNAQALKERAQQFGGDMTAGLRGRAPTLFGTQEQALAAARQRFGVRGGAAEFEKTAASGIKKEQENIEADIKLRQAQAAAKGQTFDDVSYLERMARSGNRNVALAASELLMAKGKLDAAGMKRTAEEYGKVSPLARQGYLERVSKQLNDKAEKKEFKSSGEVLASLDILSQPQKDKLLKSLERNQPLVAGELVASGLYPGKSAASIVDANFDALSNDNVLTLLDKPASWKSPVTDKLVGGRLKKLSTYMNMLNNATTPTQQAEIARILAGPPAISPR